MDVDTLFDQINNALKGSDDDAPAVGTPDYSWWLNTTNLKIAEWARDGKNTWRSLFDIRDVGTVSLNTQDYDLDDNFLVPSDYAILTNPTTGIQTNYVVCDPQERDRYTNSVYIHGAGPQIMTFSDTILIGDPVIGQAITMPGYYVPDLLTNSSDTVPVDDPWWLVYAVASEIAFNSIDYASKTADLNTKANNHYSIMASNNRRGSNNTPRQIRTNVNRIPDTRMNGVY